MESVIETMLLLSHMKHMHVSACVCQLFMLQSKEEYYMAQPKDTPGKAKKPDLGLLIGDVTTRELYMNQATAALYTNDPPPQGPVEEVE